MVKTIPTLSAIAVVAFSTAVGAQGTNAERPGTKVGDSWTYSFHDTRYSRPASSYTETVESVTADKITATWKNHDLGKSGTDVFDRDMGNLSSQGYRIRAYDFPLTVGKTWTFEYDASSGDKSWHHKVTGKVVGLEKVTVPAGTFNTAKVELTDYYNGSANGGWTWSGVVTDTRWYSPQVRNYVRRTFVDSGSSSSAPVIRELLKYSVRK